MIKLSPYEATKQNTTVEQARAHKLKKWQIPYTPNSVGKTLILTATPLIGKQYPESMGLIAQQDLLNICHKALLHEKEYGTLPLSLDRLFHPQKQPTDPLAQNPDTPYFYNPQKRQIWSVGIDYTDDGGALPAPPIHSFDPDIQAHCTDNKDIVFSIPSLR